jgi:hypothetical protein
MWQHFSRGAISRRASIAALSSVGQRRTLSAAVIGSQLCSIRRPYPLQRNWRSITELAGVAT